MMSFYQHNVLSVLNKFLLIGCYIAIFTLQVIEYVEHKRMPSLLTLIGSVLMIIISLMTICTNLFLSNRNLTIIILALGSFIFYVATGIYFMIRPLQGKNSELNDKTIAFHLTVAVLFIVSIMLEPINLIFENFTVFEQKNNIDSKINESFMELDKNNYQNQDFPVIKNNSKENFNKKASEKTLIDDIATLYPKEELPESNIVEDIIRRSFKEPHIGNDYSQYTITNWMDHEISPPLNNNKILITPTESNKFINNNIISTRSVPNMRTEKGSSDLRLLEKMHSEAMYLGNKRENDKQTSQAYEMYLPSALKNSKENCNERRNSDEITTAYHGHKKSQVNWESSLKDSQPLKLNNEVTSYPNDLNRRNSIFSQKTLPPNEDYESIMSGLERIPEPTKSTTNWSNENENEYIKSPAMKNISPDQWGLKSEQWFDKRTISGGHLTVGGITRLVSDDASNLNNSTNETGPRHLKLHNSNINSIGDLSDVHSIERSMKEEDYLSRLSRSFSAPSLYTFRLSREDQEINTGEKETNHQLQNSNSTYGYSNNHYFSEAVGHQTPQTSTAVSTASSSPVKKFFKDSPRRLASILKGQSSIKSSHYEYPKVDSLGHSRMTKSFDRGRGVSLSPKKSLRDFISNSAHKSSRSLNFLPAGEGKNYPHPNSFTRSYAPLENFSADDTAIESLKSIFPSRNDSRISSLPSEVIGEYDREKWDTLKALKKRSEDSQISPDDETLS